MVMIMNGARDVRAYADLGFWTRVSSPSFLCTTDEERKLVAYFNSQFDERARSGKVSKRFDNIKSRISEIDANHPNLSHDGVKDCEALLSFTRECLVGGIIFRELQWPHTWAEKRRWTPYDKYTKRIAPLANEIIRVNDASLVTPVTSPVKPRPLFQTPPTTVSSVGSAATSTPPVVLNMGFVFIGGSATTSPLASPVFTPPATPLRTAQGNNARASRVAVGAPQKLEPIGSDFFNTPESATGSGTRVIVAEGSPLPQTTAPAAHSFYARWFSPGKKVGAGVEVSAKTF
jgi:hypothetical protein